MKNKVKAAIPGIEFTSIVCCL